MSALKGIKIALEYLAYTEHSLGLRKKKTNTNLVINFKHGELCKLYFLEKIFVGVKLL